MIATALSHVTPPISNCRPKKHTRVKALRAFNNNLENVPDDESVFILVFNYGNYSDGLYSIQERSVDDIPKNIILAFHSYDDAYRYGVFLDTSMGQIPSVEMTHSSVLKSFCLDAGYKCFVATPGAIILPPDGTVKVTDCERERALRREEWTVQDPEIESQRQMLFRMFEMDSDDHF
jgi:hypothetical protein